MRTPRTLVTALAVSCLALAGCSQDDGDGGREASSGTSTAGATDSVEGTPGERGATGIETPQESQPTSQSPTSEPQAGSTLNGSEEHVYYLALGDSLAAGYEPPTGDNKEGGYPGPVFKHLKARFPNAEMVNLGCSGETTGTMRDGSLCAYPEGSQYAAALAHLDAHADETVLITLDLGVNDFFRCGGLDETCLKDVPQQVQTNLTQVVTGLQAKAPKAQIVLLNYYNPLATLPAQDLAQRSNVKLSQLNDKIAAVGTKTGVPVADVAAGFDFPGAQAPDQTQRDAVCELTWMCEAQDIHANAKGYQIMADAVIAELD